MRVGEVWAYREKVSAAGSALYRAEVLRLGPKGSNKVQVHVEGGEYPGLEQWVPRRRLIVPWTEAEGWLEDERCLALARDASQPPEETLSDAVEHVFTAYPGKGGPSIGWGGAERNLVNVVALTATARALGVSKEELLAEPASFLDRFGVYWAPWQVAEKLAKRIALLYTDAVLEAVAKERRELERDAVSGRIYVDRRNPWEVSAETCREWLRERQPIFDLVRSWCGEERVERFDEMEALRVEVARLRAVVEDAAGLLKSSGHPNFARQITSRLYSE